MRRATEVCASPIFIPARPVPLPASAAYEPLNKIRQRANLPALSGLTKEQLREAIWKERWYELSFINKTWYDMVRLRKAFNVESKSFDDYVGHKFSYGPVL